jgi:hypothetical protein
MVVLSIHLARVDSVHGRIFPIGKSRADRGINTKGLLKSIYAWLGRHIALFSHTHKTPTYQTELLTKPSLMRPAMRTVVSPSVRPWGRTTLTTRVSFTRYNQVQATRNDSRNSYGRNSAQWAFAGLVTGATGYALVSQMRSPQSREKSHIDRAKGVEYAGKQAMLKVCACMYIMCLLPRAILIYTIPAGNSAHSRDSRRGFRLVG